MTASARARAGSMCPAVPPPATTTHGPTCWGTLVTHFLLVSVNRFVNRSVDRFWIGFVNG
jgi:hypothetical protein